MPTPAQLRERLIRKLTELFQLNQPDLDFGFYRIMHAKAHQVLEFIDQDLMSAVADAFSTVDEARVAEKQLAYEKAFQMAMDFGAPDPEQTPAVKRAKAALETVKNNAASEAEVYDHLYRFFERYYDDGDFISRRYYSRETPGKAAPFAVPYNGEEVKLHWANADQYYIKTAEYFSNFSFDLRQAKEVSAGQGSLDLGDDPAPLRVHFRVVQATEGEHGNVKKAEAGKRFFIIHAANPVALNEDGELAVNFEYRPDPEKTGQENTWREKRNGEAVTAILSRLAGMVQAGGEHERRLDEYFRLLTMPAPTESDPKRPLLARYVTQFTARNTMDYFIHKDLGGFLRRELDFYIKNEVVHLDDIENAEAPAVETYLAKVRVMRRLALKLIDFLAQLEEFQKRLWLKKKFVVETNYCITLDRVPEELYPEISANEAQCAEWIKLFGIDDIQGDLHSPQFSQPLSKEFLQDNSKLVLDSRFFDERFKARLVASIENLDEQCDGLLIHSENFQALNLLQKRLREQVQCIYIDPPYNTDAGPISYKNGYRRSSWVSLIEDRLLISSKLLSTFGVLCATIDDYQQKELHYLIENQFGKDNLAGTVIIRVNPSGRPVPSGFGQSHEYAIFAKASPDAVIGLLPRTDSQMSRYKESDENGPYMWELFRKRGSNSERRDRPSLYYPIYLQNGNLRIPKMSWDSDRRVWLIHEEPNLTEIVIYPIDDNGVERTWRWNPKAILESPFSLSAKEKNGKWVIYYKFRPNQDGVLPLTLWTDAKYSATEHGTGAVKRLFQEYNVFSYPKSIYAVEDCISIAGMQSKQAICLDYFAGSGTTGHSVINLERKNKGKRKYVLVELGDYFDTVLKSRIAKVVYCESWKDGKPTDRHSGISHCFKYLRLESYEDTLNNLRMDDNPLRNQAINADAALKEDFMLHYLLDVETQGSQSLLNIDQFVDPTAYTLKVKKPGTDEVVTRTVDLIETFNYLIGLRVQTIAAPQNFQASFKRIPDPELPGDQRTKLVVDGQIQPDPVGPWWFRRVQGWVPRDPDNPHNGERDQVLIIWRKLSGDLERDNAVLDAWLQDIRLATPDFQYDRVYVNASNNLPNLRQKGDTWQVHLTEAEFMARMWEGGV